MKNFFLVIKTAIINTQILTISIKSYYRDLSLWFIDAFFIKILPFTDFSKPEPHCGRISDFHPMTGQATGPRRIINLLETGPPSKLESDRPRMYQMMTALSHIR